MEEQESYPPDSEDVREQIDQQRLLAAQLKEKLEHDELQLASKEQRSELLNSKLSLLKSRNKAKRNSGVTDKDDQAVKTIKGQSGVSPKNAARKQSPKSASKGKINILREQLEQNRLRFERHGLELSEDTRSMEAMVEQLRHELEERDSAIQQLQAGQVPPVPPVVEEQISEPVDVATILQLKEQEVNTLTTQVSDLQNIILELQENLKEKDCVIEARTQAISLLSEDMSKKWRANVDMLEETRQQMQIMQENFVQIEAGLNAEIEQLNAQLHSNAQKLAQAEQNVKAAEVARIDLASQNTELLEKLQTQTQTPSKTTGLDEAKSKIDELSQALSEANKLTVKLKADYKAKVKILNKQIDSLRKESDVSGELVQLQNHIAELEDEKGNLQLHLIEIEESTGNQEKTILDLEKTVSELRNEKIVAEMKLIELEDQVSSYGSVSQEVEELKLKLQDREIEIQNLQENLNKAATSLSSELLSDLQKELDEAKTAVREWQCRYEDLEKKLADKNERILSDTQGSSTLAGSHEENLVHKVEILEQSMQEKQMQVKELEALVQSSLEKINSFAFDSVPEIICENCVATNQRLAHQEAQIYTLESSINKLKEENEILKQNNEQFESIQSSSSEKSSDELSSLQSKLMEISGQLELKSEECAGLESKLKAQVEKVKKIAVNLKVKTVANKELEERVGKCESVIQSYKSEIEQLSREKQDMLEKWLTEMSEKDATLNQAADKLATQELDLHNLNDQLDSKSSTIFELESRLTALQTHAEKLQVTLEEKSVAVEALKFTNEQQDQHIENEKIAALQAEIVSIQNQLISETAEKEAAISKLENFTRQAKLKLAKEKKVRSELLEKQNELETLLAEKNNALTTLSEQNGKEISLLHEEKGRLEYLLREHQEQAGILHQQLEQERSKLQYANENLASSEEWFEETVELLPLPSMESFLPEVEGLCASVNSNSPDDALSVLETEKIKTINELSSSFETLHNQVIARLQNKPDLNGDRKLFAELRNLVTKVTNRTAALEHKIKSIVAESNSRISSKLVDAEQNIQALEKTLSEARQHIDFKETEKLNMEDAVNKLNREKLELSQQIQEESQKSLDLEVKLKETCDKVDSLTQNVYALQEQIFEKDAKIQDLQVRCQDTLTELDQARQDHLNAQHQNSELILNLQSTAEECELWKSKLSMAEQELNNSVLSISKLNACLSDAEARCESLHQQVAESTHRDNDLQHQLQASTQEVQELKQQLADAVQSYSNLQGDLSLQSDSFCQQTSSWMLEKEQFEKKIKDLTHQLQAALEHTAQHEITSSETHHVISEEEESLRQQLAEKTAEVENYQRRLIQLQMGAPDNSAPFFNQPFDKQEASEVFHFQEKVAQQESFFQTVSDASNSILDAFKPAKSLFGAPSSDQNELQSKIQNLTEQLDSLLLEKKSLEQEKIALQMDLASVTELLNSTKSELEAVQPSVNDLQRKVAELSGELDLSKSNIEQEKISSVKLENDLKQLQWKWENEKYAREKAEGELKALAQKDADDRPSIPQTLDTHVSSLQNSGSRFNDDEMPSASDEEKADESLMECNMTQLESELRGMVTSQQEGSLKKKQSLEKVGSLMTEVNELKKQLSQLVSEKKVALSQIESLQAEIKSMSQTAVVAVSSTNQPLSLESDPLMTEDDSWGWGVDSAHIEIQHQQQKNETNAQSTDVIKDLQEKIELLTEENEAFGKEKIQLAEDLKTSQIRAAKLTRKLKELKTKYDEISGKNRSSDSPFDSLDQAIEEERMKQMQGLEKELKDVQAEFNTVKGERDRLQKQVEVLSTANERMVEIKERQDVEVEMWQKRAKDVSNQVEALEWKIRELEEGKEENSLPTADVANAPQTSPSPAHSTETLNPVEIDQLLKENHTWNTNYENLMQEYQKLRAQCLADSEQHTQVDALIAQQKGMIERLEHEKTYFQDVYDSLKMDYETACAQLAAKQADEDATTQIAKNAEELAEKLSTSEKRLEETLAQLEAVASDNSEFQTKCSQLNEARKDQLRQLEQSQSQLEANAQEIGRLHENIRVLEEKSINSTSPVPVHDVFVAQESLTQGSSPSSTVLNWNNMVPGGEQPSTDIFESIANSAAQGLEEQLHLKNSELQKDKRMIETLKRTLEESELEWGQLIEYHKNQLETAKNTIAELQAELTVRSLKLEATTRDETLDLKLDYNNQIEKCVELQNVVFAKEKEIESLQIGLAVCEESKRKLEEELRSKEAEVEKLLRDVPQLSNSLPQQVIQPPTSDRLEALQPLSIQVLNSADKNLSNELDRALYMLHERDIRCEELTLELTQLLEERDGLQLRLSNAIRTNEDLRERLRQLLSSQSSDINITSTANFQEPMVSISSVENSNVSSSAYAAALKPEGHHVDLQNKLTELRTIGYSHDKRLREDSEYRHQQQMRLLSPSPTTILSGSENELRNVTDSISSPTETAQSSTNIDLNNVDQSSCVVS